MDSGLTVLGAHGSFDHGYWAADSAKVISAGVYRFKRDNTACPDGQTGFSDNALICANVEYETPRCNEIFIESALTLNNVPVSRLQGAQVGMSKRTENGRVTERRKAVTKRHKSDIIALFPAVVNGLFGL